MIHSHIPYVKAWDIVAYTHDGDAYCLDCSDYILIKGDPSVLPQPVFVSDEFFGHSCNYCSKLIQV